MIVIVDYGMGNLRSVQKALQRVGGEACVSDRPEDVARAERLVVPGVGAFGDAMRALEERGLVEPIREFVRRGRPVLGICLGLQIFFEESEETGAAAARGLALFKGRVVRFGDAVVRQGLKVPHMGWNAVEVVRPSPLFEGMPERGVYFYFAHSYYADPADETVVVGRTEYGIRFASVVARENVAATQFHPEKSQAAGLALLENFVTRF
ncbi:MAG: imidazole glycerol phosphate synthase subunit HisH [Planctomycetota bacterium]|nr:imidazole glycerol phosphate synthase subunit HisH [Planctomycetota bacterium]